MKINLSDVTENLKNQILQRIYNYKKADEDHLNELMNLKSKINQINTKREEVNKLIKIAKEEIKQVEQFEEYKKRGEEYKKRGDLD